MICKNSSLETNLNFCPVMININFRLFPRSLIEKKLNNRNLNHSHMSHKSHIEVKNLLELLITRICPSKSYAKQSYTTAIDQHLTGVLFSHTAG